MLSDLTEVWQLYFGLMFIAVVMFAPGGIAGLMMMHRPLVTRGTLLQGAAEPICIAWCRRWRCRRADPGDRDDRALHLKAGRGGDIKLFGIRFNADEPGDLGRRRWR